MKTTDGQIVMGTGQDAYARLKEIHAEILSLCGQYWNWPAVATLTRPTLARLLHLNALYDLIVDKPGVICEFGVHYGASSATLVNLRAIKEPFNYGRTYFGFDTFEGFSGAGKEDGAAADGDFMVRSTYEQSLQRLLSLQERLSPNPHIEKFKLYKGDASQTVQQWLSDQPHALIALAIFDMDIYQPTKDVLRAIMPRLFRGSVLVFDELNCPHYPGETKALLEVLDANGLRLRQSQFVPYASWALFGE